MYMLFAIFTPLSIVISISCSEAVTIFFCISECFCFCETEIPLTIAKITTIDDNIEIILITADFVLSLISETIEFFR